MRSISAAPIRTSSWAVSGLATGMRIRDGSGVRVIGRFRTASGRPRWPRARGRPPWRRLPAWPALDQIRLEQLELAGLPLDVLLGLLFGEPPVLDDQATDAAEVDRHERGHEPLDVGMSPKLAETSRS